MLRAEHLYLSVPGKVLCRDLNLTLEPGQCWGILGRNGAGKTTLLHALAGLRRPERGSITLDDQPLDRLPGKELARNIGALLQEEASPFWATVLEYVLLGRFPHSGGLAPGAEDATAARRALAALDIAELAGRELATLSGGERQRARIAQLLAQSPQIYCLDEPLQHLDLAHQLAVMDLFRRLVREGATVAMVLHEPLWASRFCDHVLLLYEGGDTIGGASSKLLTQENLERLYGCRLEKITTEHGNGFIPA